MYMSIIIKFLLLSIMSAHFALGVTCPGVVAVVAHSDIWSSLCERGSLNQLLEKASLNAARWFMYNVLISK